MMYLKIAKVTRGISLHTFMSFDTFQYINTLMNNASAGKFEERETTHRNS